MLKRHLATNIEYLDAQIGKISKELEGVKQDTKYDVKMSKLESLVEIRCKLEKTVKEGEISDAIVELDKQIEELIKIMTVLEKDEYYTTKMQKLNDLTKLRNELAESKIKGSYMPLVITGVLGATQLLMVLKHEKTDVITSKAFGWVPNLFRGR